MDDWAKKVWDHVLKDVPAGTKLRIEMSNELHRNGKFVSYDEEPPIEFIVPPKLK